MKARLVILGALLFPGALLADVPTDVYCSESFCVQIAHHPKVHPKDSYVFRDKEGVEHHVVRFEDGTVLSVLAMPSPKGTCGVSAVVVEPLKDGEFFGKGCVKSTTRVPDFHLAVRLTSRQEDARHFFSRTHPTVWGAARDGQGEYKDVATEVLLIRSKPQP